MSPTCLLCLHQANYLAWYVHTQRSIQCTTPAAWPPGMPDHPPHLPPSPATLLGPCTLRAMAAAAAVAVAVAVAAPPSPSPPCLPPAAGLTNYLVGALDPTLAAQLVARQVPSFAMYRLPGQDDESYRATWGYLDVQRTGRHKVGMGWWGVRRG